MAAVENAKYLVYKYYNEMNPNAPDCNISFAQAKQCALIAVDLAIEYNDFHIEFLQEVKKEIINL